MPPAPLLALLIWAAPAAAELVPLADFDPGSFLGTYLEVASIPHALSNSCRNTMLSFLPTALPAPALADLEVGCDRGWFHPRLHGVISSLDLAQPARAMVSVALPLGRHFQREVTVIMAAPDYSWVVIGSPTRELLLILSRAGLSTFLLDALVEHLEGSFGYARLRRRLRCTPQQSLDAHACLKILSPAAKMLPQHLVQQLRLGPADLADR